MTQPKESRPDSIAPASSEPLAPKEPLDPIPLDPNEPPTDPQPRALTPRIRAVVSMFEADAKANTEQVTYRGETLLLTWNVQTVFDQVKQHLPRMAEIAGVPVDWFESLPLLARAVHYADLQVRGMLQTEQKRSPMGRIRELRRKAAVTAELAAMAGFVSPQRVAEIKAGSGRKDLLEDGLAYEELFADYHDLLTGPLVVTPSELTELAELSDDMLGNVRPPRGRKRQTEVDPFILRRNELYSMLHARYEKLRAVLPAVVGSLEEALRIAPSLHARGNVPVRESDVSLPELEEAPPAE